jgi:hypothetical protein
MRTKLKTWASRIVVVIAALASVATSRKRYHTLVAFPAGAATTTDASHGLLIQIETKQPSRLDGTCKLGGREALRPGPVEGSFLCPPGGRLGEIYIDAPPDEPTRITSIRQVEMWTATAELAIDMVVPTDTYAENEVVVDTPEGTADLVVEPVGADARYVRGRSMVATRAGHNLFPIVMFREAGAPDRALTVQLHLVAHVVGVCAQPGCTAPPIKLFKVESRP